MKQELEKERTGYKEDFLGNKVILPMPKVGLEHETDIFRSDNLKYDYLADYTHFSLVMSSSKKQAFFSAANIDMKKYREEISSRKWFIDSRIGVEHQVGPEAYVNNVWDRGHLTRRADVTWGSDNFEAKSGSNDSCSYSNACLQHENFNQDEWTVPEDAIHTCSKSLNGKLCVFTGPVFTDSDRWYKHEGMDPVRIPSGFWKVVAYIDKTTRKLACQAYVMYQDLNFVADKHGKYDIKLDNFQVTITEIEHLTGLEFPRSLFESNPLYFYPRPAVNKEGPEGFKTLRKNAVEKKEGVIFSREDTEKPHFRNRRFDMTKENYAGLIMKSKK